MLNASIPDNLVPLFSWPSNPLSPLSDSLKLRTLQIIDPTLFPQMESNFIMNRIEKSSDDSILIDKEFGPGLTYSLDTLILVSVSLFGF